VEKYKIVLKPKDDVAKGFYNITKNCKNVSTGYFMSPDTSIPHITLVSFSAEEEALPKIWSRMNHFRDVRVHFEDLGSFLIMDDNFVFVGVKSEGIKEIKDYTLQVLRYFTDKISKRTMGSHGPYLSLFSTEADFEEVKGLLDCSILKYCDDFLFDIALVKSGKNGMVKEIIFK
jgi:hypothetical protein